MFSLSTIRDNKVKAKARQKVPHRGSAGVTQRNENSEQIRNRSSISAGIDKICYRYNSNKIHKAANQSCTHNGLRVSINS